jgi:hypothetical protein
MPNSSAAFHPSVKSREESCRTRRDGMIHEMSSSHPAWDFSPTPLALAAGDPRPPQRPPFVILREPAQDTSCRYCLVSVATVT